MKRNQVLCGLGALILAVAPAAHATLLLPNLEPSGVESPLSNDTQNNLGNPIGTLVASTGTESITNTNSSGTATISGSFISEVYREAGGTLDFYYQVSIGAGSTSFLEDMDVSNFLASSVATPNGVNAGETGNVALFGTSGVPGACGFGANPACTPVTLTGANTGTSVPFLVSYDATGTLNNLWLSPVSAGETTVVLAVSTNDTLFDVGTASLDGSLGTSDDLSAFQPLASSVPEPVSLVLLGTTLALAALFIRRRHSVNVSKAQTKS